MASGVLPARFGPMKLKGEARPINIGSVNMCWPLMLTSKVEWPTHVTCRPVGLSGWSAGLRVSNPLSSSGSLALVRKAFAILKS